MEPRDDVKGARIERVLKADLFGSVELVEAPRPCGARARLIRRVVTTRPGAGLVAGLLARREAKILRLLEEAGSHAIARLPDLAPGALDEIARLPSPTGARVDPRRVHVRAYAEGLPLHRATALPLDFFDLLEAAAGELHALGICHNDLHKEQNVVVAAEDGAPVLIDFQLATHHPGRRGRWFEARVRDDLRHLQKHRRRYTRDGRGPAEIGVPEEARIRRRGIALVWRRTGKPLYNLVTRKLLRTRDGEEIRPSTGPWPRWTEPIGSAGAGAAVDDA